MCYSYVTTYDLKYVLSIIGIIGKTRDNNNNSLYLSYVMDTQLLYHLLIKFETKRNFALAKNVPLVVKKLGRH